MLAEEKRLRKHLSFLRAITSAGKSERTITMRLITALVKAVREEDAKMVEEGIYDTTNGYGIAAAIRGRK